MIKFENGVGEIKGNAPTILFETTEILRCVRKSLEERMSKEDADKWIDKVVRRSAMTEKEEIIDSIKGVKDGLKKLKEKLGDEKRVRIVILIKSRMKNQCRISLECFWMCYLMVMESQMRRETKWQKNEVAKNKNLPLD